MPTVCRFVLAVAGLLGAGTAVHAQAKRPLTQADWDRWESIASPMLSPDGKWAAYTVNPRVGDGTFVVRSTSAVTEYRVNLGYTNRDNNTPGARRARGGAPGGGAGGRGGRGATPTGVGPFSADNRFAFVTVANAPKAQVDSVEAAQRAAGRGGVGARAGAAGRAASPATQVNRAAQALYVIRLADGNIETVKSVRAFRVADANGRWLAYQKADTAAPDSAGPGASGEAAGVAGGRAGAAQNGPRRTYGSDVVLRDLSNGAEVTLSDVSFYAFDDSARVLAYVVTSRDSTKDGVYLRDLPAGTTRPLMTGPGNYRAFAFDHAQQQYVFTSDRDEFGKSGAHAVLYYGTVKAADARPLLATAALPSMYRFPDNPTASFTRAGNAVLVGISPPRVTLVPDDSLTGKARFDLWHWDDPVIQPEQLLRVTQDANPVYQGVVDIATKKFTRLTSDSFPTVTLSDDARAGLLSTNVPYEKQSSWGAGGTDVYFVDPATGARKLLAAKVKGPAQLSTGGKYIAWFDKAHWYAYTIATGRTVDLNAGLASVHVEQETWSTPDEPPGWGIAGWTKDDQAVLINDRFDIWAFDPSGARPPVILTDSLGRREHITLRVIALDRDVNERWLDASKPAWLSAFDEDTKESGFYRTRLDARRAPGRVTMDKVRYGTPSRADKADVYLLTRMTFQEPPNLWVGPSVGTATTRISDINAFQKEYSWGTAELVTWTSLDGVPRQGILFRPENFDPARKYPMITYFYEDLSDGLYNYIAPNGGTSVNITHYVSNGYVMFEPDIYYEMGHPGQSAVKSIVPGVQKVLEGGFVDPTRLGLQGHSWGGYQTAYLITQTSMFAAAEAGAPVSDMISAYGGIRWGSGLNRAFQYEATQSRIGKSIWEGLPLYLENSPLFALDRVRTPLLILHNDHDDAVPWYQGIELYIGMRRLGKEAYFFNYNDELHGIQGRANQKDWAMRMQTFFDVKLKGRPMPEWMQDGIKAVDKGRDQLAPAIRP